MQATTTTTTRGTLSSGTWAMSKLSKDDSVTNEMAPPRPVILLALDDHWPPTDAIVRASRAATALGGDLHVVAALAKHRRDEPAKTLTRIVDRIRDLAPSNKIDVELRAGDLSQIAIHVGRRRNAVLVIVSPDAGGDGDTAAKVADALKVPVLVARTPRPNGAMVAATDMAHLQYPVLVTSRQFAQALDTPLMFFHNATPVSMFTLNPMISGTPYIDTSGVARDAAEAKLSRLRALAGSEDDVDVVVARSHETLDAILEVAVERKADIVAIGHRRRSWIARTLGRHLTAKVADRCDQSVLIVPVEGV